MAPKLGSPIEQWFPNEESTPGSPKNLMLARGIRCRGGGGMNGCSSNIFNPLLQNAQAAMNGGLSSSDSHFAKPSAAPTFTARVTIITRPWNQLTNQKARSQNQKVANPETVGVRRRAFMLRLSWRSSTKCRKPEMREAKQI